MSAEGILRDCVRAYGTYIYITFVRQYTYALMKVELHRLSLNVLAMTVTGRCYETDGLCSMDEIP